MVVAAILGVVKMFVPAAGLGVPVVSTDPPEDAAYQSITAPEEEADIATVPVPHRALSLAIGALGAELIVNVFEEVVLEQVPFPVAVSVRVILPAEISPALGV
jgi:hypothetical protein